MDTALYERGNQLLDSRLKEHKKARRLGSVRSMEEANVPEILKREAVAEKHASRRKKAPNIPPDETRASARHGQQQKQEGVSPFNYP